MTNPFQSLQHTEAQARFELLDVDVVRRPPRPGLRRRDVPLGHHDPVHLPGRRDVRRPQAARGGRDPAQRPTRSTPTCSSAAGSRSTPSRATNELVVDATMRVPQRRRGAAPQRRPGRRAALRLRHVLHGRGAQHLRLLRPAGPQGAVHLPRHRAGRLGGRRQRARRAGRARASGSSSRRSRCRRTSSRWSPGPTTSCATSTTASRSACSARASLARRPRRGRRRAVHDDQAVLRRVPPAVRHPLPVRRLPPGVRARSSTPARWRTRAA